MAIAEILKDSDYSITLFSDKEVTEIKLLKTLN